MTTKRNWITYECLECAKETKYHKGVTPRKYCSRYCYHLSQKHASKETKLKMRIAKLGKSLSKEHKKKIGDKHRGRKWPPRTAECRLKMSIAKLGTKIPIHVRKKMSIAHQGEKASCWKGGITPIHLKIRGSLEYRLWREEVFKRDSYTCVLCGDKKGGNLNADHIKPFAYYPELRFNIDNGRTLCIECHKNTDTYGGRASYNKSLK